MEIINKLGENFYLAFFKKLRGLCFALSNQVRAKELNYSKIIILNTKKAFLF